MTFERAMELVVPYLEDGSKDRLEQLISEYPGFKKDFEDQITPEYESDISKRGLFFVINNDSWKWIRQGFQPLPKKLKLGYVGKEKLPLMSFNI